MPISESRAHALLDLVAELVIGADASGQVTFVNSALARAVGTSADALLDRQIAQLGLAAPLAAAVERAVAAACASGTEQEVIANVGEGPLLSEYRGRAVPTGAARPAAAALVVLQEIGSARRLERERDWLIAEGERARAQADAAMQGHEEFLALMSHELRSPLNSITGWTHVLEQAIASADANTLERAVDGIKRSAAQQSRLITDLMDAAYLLSGKLKIYPSPVAVEPALVAAIDSARPAADAKRVTIALEPMRAGCPDALADPDRMQQMVWNLLANAVKFSPAGATVSVRALAACDGRVAIEVSDQGRGFNPERIERALAGAPGSGMGVGLSLVRRLAELHGGQLAAASEGEGRGATFRLVLPAHDARHRAVATTGTSLAGVRVLLLGEADTGATGPASIALASAGAQVRDAPSFDAALDLLAIAPIDAWPQVLVCDVGSVSPRDGPVRKLRALEARREVEGTRRVRTLALTASDRAEDQTRLVLAGFESLLAKPFAPPALVAAVASLAGAGASARLSDA